MRPAQTRQLTIWYNTNRRNGNSIRPSTTAPTSRRPYRYCSSRMAVTGRASINRLTCAARTLKAAEPRASRRPRITRPIVNQNICPSQAPVDAASQTRTGSSTPCAESVAATMRMPSPSSSVPPNTASRPYLETRAAREPVVTGSTIWDRGRGQQPLRRQDYSGDVTGSVQGELLKLALQETTLAELRVKQDTITGEPFPGLPMNLRRSRRAGGGTPRPR